MDFWWVPTVWRPILGISQVLLNLYSNPIVFQKHTFNFNIVEKIEDSEIKEFAEWRSHTLQKAFKLTFDSEACELPSL